MTIAEARQIVARRQLVEHEAGHATAAVLLGLPLKEIRVERFSGAVRPDLCREGLTPANARSFALVVLPGGLQTGEPYWPPTWPLFPLDVEDDPLAGDKRSLRSLVSYMGLDRSGYDDLVLDAHRLVCRSDFDQLAYGLGIALEQRDVLGAEAIEAVRTVVFNNLRSMELAHAAA